MTTDAERLEKLDRLFDDIIERSDKEPIIVEGSRDVEALKALGVARNVLAINRGVSIVAFCEEITKQHSKFIILTDWDRKGGHLAQLLRRCLESCDAKHDSQIRGEIARLTKKDVKDVEGLPSYIERLRRSVESGTGINHRKQVPGKD